MRVPGRFVVLGRFRLQQPFRCSAGAHRAQAAQPAAGSRCSCGAGGHGARTAAGAAERVRARLAWWPGRRSDRAETPGPLLRGGRAWAGCRGSQCQRRGCRNSEGVATPGALAGAAALRIAAAVLARAALRSREYLPDGVAVCGLLLLSGSAARAFAAAARGTGAAPTGWRSSSQLPPPHRVSGGGAGGGVPFSRMHGQE